MKSKNLKIMQSVGVNIPEFTTVKCREILSSQDRIKLETFLDKKEKSRKGTKYAVRSACSIEDGTDKSYAGQFNTLLNVERHNIMLAVGEINQNILNYDFENNIDKNINNKDIIESSEIIVQEMINAKLSGVVFSVNPMGLLNETVITVGKGLGCNVVDSRIETTTYHYNRDDSIVYKDNNTDLLKVEQIEELKNISEHIKGLFNSEIDIEFAIDKQDIIWILQARPITTIANTHKIVLDNSNIVESYPGVVMPLSQEFVKDMYTEVFTSCLKYIDPDGELIQSLEPELNNFVEFVNGRVYYRINSFYEILQLVPCSSILIKIWQSSLGINNKEITKSRLGVSKPIKLKNLFKLYRALDKTPDDMNKLNKYFNKIYNIYTEQLEDSNTVEEIFQLYDKMKSDLCSKWGVTLVNDLYAFLYTYRVKDKALISDIKTLESMKPVQMLNEIISIEDKNSKEYKDKVNEYIQLYGDRCIGELKLETQTFRTNPELFVEYVKDLKISNIDENKISDIKTTNAIIAKAKIGIKNREASRLNRTRIFGLVRQMYLKLGQMLVDQNRILNQRDIFYLTVAQIKSDKEQLLNEVAEAKYRYAQFLNMKQFNRLEYADNIFDIPLKSCSTSTEMLNDNNIIGEPISGGEIEGEVVIIDKPDINIDVKDKIIVTESTDPGWVLLIKNCKGIIAERGSLLSHTAIISRELHKPAIVNVKNITNILTTGNKIRMSGTTGKIEKIN